MSGIRAVAKRAGVSAATVSRVLNGRGSAREEIRQAVERAATELEYRPNFHARRLRGMRSNIIALVFTEMAHPFSAEVALAIEDIARQNDYFIILGNTRKDTALFDHYLETFISYGVDGLVIVPPVINTHLATTLQAIPIPCVVIDQQIPGLAVDQVITDNVAGAYRLTRHLLDVGHRRIAFLGGHPRTQKGRERLAGYQKALTEYNVPIERGLIRMRDFNEESGRELTMALLRETRPDALFAANMNVQVGVLQAVRSLGLHVPDDLALAGFDDLPYASEFAPFLTVVAQQTRTIGVVAAQLLIDKLMDKRAATEHQTLFIQPELIVRSSSAPSPRNLQERLVAGAD